MSDTPRTDAEQVIWNRVEMDGQNMVGVAFARTLERELSAERADVAILKKALGDAANTIAADGQALAAMTAERDVWKRKYAALDNTSRQLEDVLIATRVAKDKAVAALKAMRPECDYESDEEMERCIALRNGIISELEDMK